MTRALGFLSNEDMSEQVTAAQMRDLLKARTIVNSKPIPADGGAEGGDRDSFRLNAAFKTLAA